MISREEIENLAQLARLKLTDEEAAGLQKDISNILEYVGQIATAAETPASLQDERGRLAGVSAASAPLHNVMRADTPREATDPLAGREEALRAAFPAREVDFAAVRKIIERD